MYLIYLASTLLLIWISVAGVTLISHRFLSDIAIARSVGLLLVALVLFFVEHFIGLGNLHWMLPITVLVGAWMIWKGKQDFSSSGFWSSELVFALSFLYGFLWRYSFPGISASSEKITDLFFISNYYPGDTLPPLDNWNPPNLFDYYYAFQHYASALFGRVFNLDIGTCYNLSFALLAALPLTLAWSVSGLYIQKKALRVLLVCTLALGGTGFSPILHLAIQSPDAPDTNDKNKITQYEHALGSYSRRNIIDSVRFIGGDNDKKVVTEIQSINSNSTVKSTANSKPQNKELTVLPSENFGYQFFLGDYHPPLGGFFLLALSFALIAYSEKNRESRLGQALLALCVPVMLITNTWTFPLLMVLILVWLSFRLIYRQPIDWLALIFGGLIGTFLIYPFLIGFTANSLPTPVDIVTRDLHTPISRFLGLHWPIILLLSFGFFEKKYRRLSLTLSVTWLMLLLVSEFIFIDDPTGGKYQRTNTVMKWWGWIQTGVVLSLGAVCLGSSRKWIRWSTVLVFMTINIIAVDLARYWHYTGKYYQGKLAGHHWYTQNDSNRMMFEFLKDAPKGIVLENIYDNSFCNTSIFGIFNDKPVLLGWPSHLSTWHGSVPRVWILKDEIVKFYRGEMDNPQNWLESHNVQYIVFGGEDHDAYFTKINNQIKSSYEWHEYNHSRQRHTGLWIKISNSSDNAMVGLK
jgi:uncharacterized membrane protein